MAFQAEVESLNPDSAGLCIEVTYSYDRASKTSELLEFSISHREEEQGVSLSIQVIPEGDEP